MNYANYIFDLYGTLIDIHTDEGDMNLWQYMADYLKQHFDVTTTAEKLQQDYLQICAEEEKKLAAKNGSKHPEIKIEWVWNRLIGKPCSDDEMKKLCVSFREKSRDKFICYEGVHTNLQAIKDAGGKVYLLSNAQRLFTEKELLDADLEQYFDDIFISSDMGVKKPDGKFINTLIEKNGLDKSKTVMVGNEVMADVGSAVAAGVDAIYLNAYSHPKEEVDRDLEKCGATKSDINLTIINKGEKSFKEILD